MCKPSPMHRTQREGRWRTSLHGPIVLWPPNVNNDLFTYNIRQFCKTKPRHLVMKSLAVVGGSHNTPPQ